MNEKINELMKLSGSSDLEKISEAAISEIARLFQSGKIDNSYLIALAAKSGEAYSGVIKAVNLLNERADKLQETHIETWKAISTKARGGEDTYKELIKKAKSDATLEAISKDLIEFEKEKNEGLKTMERIVKEQNQMLSAVLAGMYIAGTAALAVFGATLFINNKDSNSSTKQ